MKVVPTSPEEIPEIQLDEVVEDTPPAKPAPTAAPPDIDIDLGDRDAAATESPNLDDRGTAATLETELELDMSVGSLALDNVPSPASTAKPAPAAKTPAGKPSLDLDSLLSDIDLGAGAKPNEAEAVDLSVDKAPNAGDEPAVDVSLDDAPPLPLADDEPAPVSAVPAAALKPTAQTVATLKRLAGIDTDPEQARAALRAALKGEPYDAAVLPPPKAMLLGMARILVSTGYSVNEMVDAIIDAMAE
ncbi:MAG: hypothetical protein HYZ27_11915 [Deltaproteobacteria bacterium]|nr:hypothetical protein [Deltaproteobacteria bacterium]